MYAKYAKLRDERGFNDLKVAEAVGISPSTIYDWRQRSEDNPEAKLSVDKIYLIAKLFGVPIEYFLEEEK